MTAALLKALLAELPVLALLVGSALLFSREKSVGSTLQVLGAGCLQVVVLTHICEALQLFPSMHWGEEGSIGHYVDLAGAVLGVTLFPAGYFLDAWRRRLGTTSARK